MIDVCVALLSCKSLKQNKMKRFIQTTLFFAVLAIIAIYSTNISKFIVDNYNVSIAYLANNLVKVVNPLGF